MAEVLSLLAVTLTEIAILIVGSLSSSPNLVSRRPLGRYCTSTTLRPATYAFAIWGVIYTWGCLWIIYAWSFVL